MKTIDHVRESNKIEGILRDPTDAELAEFDQFLALPIVDLGALNYFVHVYQPNARLRDRVGMNVMVGASVPPDGGPEVYERLQFILERVNAGHNPWDVHLIYERLHPFTDCNGRSGRMLWHWQMARLPGYAGITKRLGFLHAFYYQTLENLAS